MGLTFAKQEELCKWCSKPSRALYVEDSMQFCSQDCLLRYKAFFVSKVIEQYT